jgi:hypothetical protein
MGRTISFRWRKRGTVPLLCAYCGVKWPSDKLVVDADGKLRCPDEGTGKPAGELSRLNAQGAREAAARRTPRNHDPRFR